MAAFLVNFAISAGLALAGRALAPQPKAAQSEVASGPQPVNAPEVRYTEKQSVPPKRLIFGRAEVGGAICFEEVNPPYLYRMFMLCDEPIAGVRGIRIAKYNLLFPRQDLPLNTPVAPVITSGLPDYPNRLMVCYRDGNPNQTADAMIAAAFPGLGADFRQRGIATISARMHYGSDWDERQALWGGGEAPDLLFMVDGVGVPDPRQPTNIIFYDPNDPDAAAAARATWTRGINNAALVQAYYLTHPSGGRIDPSRIDWDKVMRAAEYDDELIGTKSGKLIRRHTIDTVINMRQQPNEVIDSMRAANRGFILNSGSRVWVTSSIPQEPVATIHDGMLAGGIQYRDAQPKRDTTNRVKVRFLVDERNFQMDDGPILDRADLQSTDGELLETTLDLPTTRDHRRAQRLQKCFLDEKRLGRTLTVSVDVGYLAECKGRLAGYAHRFESANFPKASGIYFCRKATYLDGFASIRLDLFEYDRSIESDWHPEVDEQDFVLADLDLD